MPIFKIPKHNSLDGQTVEYNGQTFVLKQNGVISASMDMPSDPNLAMVGYRTDVNGNLVPTQIPVPAQAVDNRTRITPTVTINPTMRFDTDANGRLVLRINPNPTIDYGDRFGGAPIQAVPYVLPETQNKRR